MLTKKILAAAVVAGAFSFGAHADLVTSSSGLSLIEDFESFDGLVVGGATPVNLGGLTTFISDSTATLGAYAVDLVDNGTWGAGNNFAGIGNLVTATGSFVGSMTFNLAGPVSSVGALFNIYNDGFVPAEITIDALGAGGGVLETFSFVVSLGDPFATNAGLFRGFERLSADILGLRVSGDGFVVDNLMVTAPVPLPAALPLLLAGLGGLAGIGARRRKLAAG